MARNQYSAGVRPGRQGWRLIWLSLVLAGGAFLFVYIWSSPVNSFHPLCTYTVNARVSADVEVGGTKLSATVVHQNSRSRNWISIMNSAGCKPRYGSALVYRMPDDRVLIVPARLCPAAEKKLARSGEVDVLQECTGNQATQEAFVVDSATHPRKWRAAVSNRDFRITAMTATSTRSNPSDDIETVAPNLLKSYFGYDRRRSSGVFRSPESLVSYARRYDLKKKRPDNAFEFEVKYEER